MIAVFRIRIMEDYYLVTVICFIQTKFLYLLHVLQGYHGSLMFSFLRGGGEDLCTIILEPIRHKLISYLLAAMFRGGFETLD